ALIHSLVIALLAGGIGGVIGASMADGGGSSAAAADHTPQPAGPSIPVTTAIAEQALPATVSIDIGRPDGEPAGSGFVLDAVGHVVTNYHVISSVMERGAVTVKFPDGRSASARIVGGAEGYDLAVLRIEGAANMRSLPLGDSAAVRPGDPVLAIGTPFGMENSVTAGIISATNRPVPLDEKKAAYIDTLQTDTPLNPGNSGGPLLDAQGRVIGVNSAIFSRAAENGQMTGSVGVGFSIPVNQVKRVAAMLISTGKPVYAQLGLTLTPETATVPRIAATTPDGRPGVDPGGPADLAGLRPGDTITRIGARRIPDTATFSSELLNHNPGETVTLTYQRNGQETTAQLTLTSRDPANPLGAQPHYAPR
ncbi:MAG: PDZ domain-containing protein, partial [Hamadaea sp.]|nr:PDZ domain-containing protein [Hamadaea sp.]